mgnify:CR=1 FL=1
MVNRKNNRLPDEPRRTHRQTRLNLRLTDLEFAFVKQRAEGFGLPLAKFVRVFLLELPKPEKRLHDLPIVEPQLLRQLISIGNNVNQLTRYAHTVSLDPKQNLDVLQLAFALQKIADELENLRLQYSLDKAQLAQEKLLEDDDIDEEVATVFLTDAMQG